MPEEHLVILHQEIMEVLALLILYLLVEGPQALDIMLEMAGLVVVDPFLIKHRMLETGEQMVLLAVGHIL